MSEVIKFLAADGTILYAEGDDYNDIDRPRVASIVITIDGEVAQTYLPTQSQMASNAIFRQRVFRTNNSLRTVKFFGFPGSVTDPIFLLEGGVVTEVTPTPSNPTIYPLSPRTGEFVVADTRILIGHTSMAEMNEYTSRLALDTPYVVEETVGGDVYPGDYTDITTAKTWTNNNRAAIVWPGPVSNNPGGHVLSNTNTAFAYSPIHFTEVSNYRDACAWAMLNASTPTTLTLARVLRDIFVDQYTQAGLDFSDSSRFCHNDSHSNSQLAPMWRMGTWATKWAHSYMYLSNYEIISGNTLFTTSQHTDVKAWFFYAARWFMHGVVNRMDGTFTNWDTASSNGPWTIIDDSQRSEIPYDGGPNLRQTQVRFTNRDLRTLRGALTSSIDSEDWEYVPLIKRAWKGYLMYQYSGAGWTGDFERGSAANPWQGLKYAQECYGGLAIMADLLGRYGDSELLDFETTVSNSTAIVGNHQPTNGPRSLWTLGRDLAAYDTGDYTRNIGGARIRTKSDRIDDSNLLVLNHYAKVHGKYAADYVYNVFKRKATGTTNRPANFSTGQDVPPDNGVFPGQGFFFFVDLPDSIDPWTS